MENLVKNVYTAYRIDNTTEYNHYISVKGAKLSGQIFGFDLWLYTEGDSNVLVSQEKGFSLGIVQDKVVLKTDGKTLTVRSELLQIPENQWINLYMGYDGSEISVLINGNVFGTASFSGDMRNGNEFLIGREFTGYVRSFRLYNAVLDEQKFRTYFMQTEYQADSMPELLGFIDMTQKKMTDLSGKGMSAESQAGCTYMDLVDVYCPGIGGVISFTEPDGINPGGFSSGQFSVYIKLYLRPGKAGRQILFTNGAPGDDDSMTLYCDKTGDKTAFVFQYGKEELSFDSQEEDYSWVDVIVCADGKAVSAYINQTAYQKTAGQALTRKGTGDFRIGGYQKSTGMICTNYIHTVAIFENVLTGQDASDFMKNHPFILEDDLAALVTFEGGTAYELADGAEITAGQEGLFPAQRTVDTIPSEPYQFRVNYTKEAASDIKQWQAKQIATAYKDYGNTMTGCTAAASTAVVTALTSYISRHEKLIQSVWELYEKARIETDEAVHAMSSIEQAASKTLAKAFQFVPKTTTASTAAAGAAAAVAESSIVTSQQEYAGLFAIGSRIAAVIASNIISDINKIHEDKPDEEEKKDISVEILSITFQHTPDDYTASAVRCRNRQETITGPEWTSGSHCTAPAVYIADQLKKVKIKMKYRITDKSKVKAGTYSVSILGSVMTGGENLFDQFEYKADAQKAGVDYEVEMESSVTANAEQKLQYTQVKLWWDCRVNEDFMFLPDTLSDLYILPGVPASPIFLEKGCDSGFPAIEYLDIFTKLLGTQKTGRKSISRTAAGYTQEQLKQATQLIFFAPCFRYLGAPTPQYVIRSQEGKAVILTFREKTFFDDVEQYVMGQRDPLEIECEVYAAVLYYYLHLLGVTQPQLAFISNPGDDHLLHTNKIYPAGHLEETPVEKEFSYHVVVALAESEEKGETQAQIYDASMGSMEQDGRIRPFAALPFRGTTGLLVDAPNEPGTYRAAVIKDNTGATISDNYVFVSDKDA